MRLKSLLVLGVFGLILVSLGVVSAGKTLYMTADNAIAGKNVLYLDESTQSWIHDHSTKLNGNPSLGYYLYYPKVNHAIPSTPDGDNHVPPLSTHDNYWISKNSYTGSFSTGIWKFFVRVGDRGAGSDNGQFHINLFRCTSQSNTATCTYLLNATGRLIGHGDSGTMIQFNFNSASSFSFNNEYILAQLYNYKVNMGGSDNHLPEVSLEYSSALSRIETPGFTVVGCAPSCGSSVCGPDPVCGESCGTCTAGTECQNGACVLIGHSCLSSDDTIMKLYQQTNSDGALWNYSNYYWDICYSSVFGIVYGGDITSVHNCVGTNKVIGLYDISNSHAEIPSLNTYDYDVCYGNLECINDNSAGENCLDSTRKVVVRLKESTNSHISDASDTSYPIKICCKSPIIPVSTITGAYFANMSDKPINKSDLNDLVKLVVSGELLQNKEINYTIYKSIWWWFDKEVAQTPGVGFITWRAGSKTGGGLEEGLYYFKARVTGESKDIDTRENENVNLRYLEVTPNENNQPPVARITGLKDRQIYFLEKLNFSQDSYDEDDDFTYIWDLGNGETRAGNSISLENYHFDYTYTTPGQKDIILTVTDSRGLTDRDKVSILILDATSEQVLAYISKPVWDEFIIKKEIDFNATLSYAAQYIDKDTSVNCLAGPCPSKTEGCPPESTLPFPSCKLDVINIPGWDGLNDLYFNWTFINGLFPSIKKYYGAAGISGAITTAEYDNPAVPSKPHKAILKVTY